MAFKGYHLEHHRVRESESVTTNKAIYRPSVLQYQGQDVIDTDIPTNLEARLFCTTFGKFVWVCFQPLFYALRPLFTNPKKPIKLEFVNTAVQLTFDFVVWYFLGTDFTIFCTFWQVTHGFCPLFQAGRSFST